MSTIDQEKNIANTANPSANPAESKEQSKVKVAAKRTSTTTTKAVAAKPALKTTTKPTVKTTVEKTTTKSAVKPTNKPTAKPVSVKSTDLAGLLQRFEELYLAAKSKEEREPLLYYVLKRMNQLIDAQGKLMPTATPQDTERESAYKEKAKHELTASITRLNKKTKEHLDFSQALEVFKRIKREKMEAVSIE